MTPEGTHYVRNHYPTPETDAEEWTVSLTGLIAESGETGPDADGPAVGMDELREDYPAESVVHTMECSGNGRTFFEPDAEGHQWTDGAVSTAVWTGTPVRALLEEYDAADEGWVTVMGGDAPEGEEVFCRSLPMEKVREGCVLAYEMNGHPLPPDHGHPVRLLVPGWFGNNSVKWVERLHIAESMPTGEEWEGYTKYQQLEYRLRFDDSEERSSSGSRTEPDDSEEPEELDRVKMPDTYEQMAADQPRHAYFYDQLPKSLITAPADGATLRASEAVEITGLAWAGETASSASSSRPTFERANLFRASQKRQTLLMTAARRGPTSTSWSRRSGATPGGASERSGRLRRANTDCSPGRPTRRGGPNRPGSPNPTASRRGSRTTPTRGTRRGTATTPTDRWEPP